MSNRLIALQLYTVRDETAHDFKAVVRQVAKMGYVGVEFAGYGGLMARELAALALRFSILHLKLHIRPRKLTIDN